MITLLTKKNGKTVIFKNAKPSATLDDICELAECEVNDGYADYSCVFVDGEIYAEFEN